MLSAHNEIDGGTGTAIFPHSGPRVLPKRVASIRSFEKVLLDRVARPVEPSREHQHLVARCAAESGQLPGSLDGPGHGAGGRFAVRSESLHQPGRLRPVQVEPGLASERASELSGRGSRWMRQKSQSLTDGQMKEVAAILQEFDRD